MSNIFVHMSKYPKSQLIQNSINMMEKNTNNIPVLVSIFHVCQITNHTIENLKNSSKQNQFFLFLSFIEKIELTKQLSVPHVCY